MSVIELPSKVVELSAEEKEKGNRLINAILDRSWEIIYNILYENPNSGLYQYINEHGATPLNYALCYGMVNLSIDLINRMTHISIGNSCLTFIEEGNPPQDNKRKLIDIIIRSGKFDFKSTIVKGGRKNTILTYMCRLGFEDEALFIVTSSQDYDINFADENGNTALLLAAQKNMNRVVEKLMSNPKCNLSVVNSALHFVEYYLKANKNYEMLVKLKSKNYLVTLEFAKSILWIDKDKFYEWYLSVNHEDFITQLNRIQQSMNAILHADNIVELECPSPSRIRPMYM